MLNIIIWKSWNEKVSALYREAYASLRTPTFCIVCKFTGSATRYKLRDKGPRPFHSKIFTKLFSFFVRQRKIKTKKENTKSFLQKKIDIHIRVPPFVAYFHFPFYFYFFIFFCLTKSKNTMQIFPHFFRAIFSLFIFDQSWLRK